MQPTHAVTEVVCEGVGTLGTGADEPTQILDTDAVRYRFIPATDISAIRISPHRILVTGGVTGEGRVLPLTVLRYLDLGTSSTDSHAWSAPVPLRDDTQSQASQKRRRKRVEVAYPVSRTAHTLTLAPDGLLYLIGGLKLGGREEGHPCKSIFALDHARESWASIDSPQASSKSKADRTNFIGTRFAHATVHYCATPSGRSARARARSSGPGSLLVHGGYVSKGDRLPVSTVHAFDIRTERWSFVEAQKGVAPARAYHASVMYNDHHFVIHGGNCGDHKDQANISAEVHIFDVKNLTWIQPQLHRDSDPGPSARKLHCAVNGIGAHSGTAVFYGGELPSGDFASSLHTLRLVEDGGNIAALWHEHQVSPRNPIALASGALVASPELAQYFVIGGRGPNGLRNYPFAISANEEETGQREESSPMDTAGSIPLRIRRHKPSKSISDIDNSSKDPTAGTGDVEEDHSQKGAKDMSSVGRSRLNRSSAAKNNRGAASAKAKSLPIRIPSPEVVSSRGTAAVASPVNAESDRAKLRNDTSMLQKSHKKIKSGLKRPRKSPTPKTATPIRNADPVPAVSRIVWTEPLNKADAVAPPGDSIGDGTAMFRGQPALRLSRAARVSSSAQEPSFNDTCTPSPNDEMAFAAPGASKKRLVECQDENGASQENQDGDPMDITRGVEVDPNNTVDDSMPDSIEQDFITSEVLAQRGRAINRARIQARNRGRPRGTRGRGAGRLRAEIPVNMVLEEKFVELQSENIELKTKVQRLVDENDALKKDNRSLNDQCNDNLMALRELGNIRALGEMENASGPNRPAGRRTATEIIEDNALSALNRERDAKVASLRSQLQDKEEKYREALKNSEEIGQELKNVERRCEEFNKKYLDEKGVVATVKDLYEFSRSKLDEFRDLAQQSGSLALKFRQEKATLEAVIVEKDRKISDLNLAKSDSDRRVQNGLAELSAAKRENAILQSRLSEAQQKTTRHAQTEDQSLTKNKFLEEKLFEVQQASDEQKAMADRLKEKNVDLVAQLKTSQSEHLDKIAECERIVIEATRAKELATEKQRELSKSLTEQAQLRKECDRLKAELATVRQGGEIFKRNIAAEFPKLLKAVHSLSSVVDGTHLAVDVFNLATGAQTRPGEVAVEDVDNDVVITDAPVENAARRTSGPFGVGDGSRDATMANGTFELQHSTSMGAQNAKQPSDEMEHKRKRVSGKDVLVSSSEGTEGSPLLDEEDPEP